MYQMIEDRMSELGITIQGLAEKLDVNMSTVSRFLNGKNEIKFETLFEMIQLLFDAKEQPKICKYYFARLTNKRNIKCALEYFSANNDYEQVKNIINRESNQASNDLKELLYLYDLIYRLVYCKEDPTAIVEDKNNNNAIFKTKEAQALLSVAKLDVGAMALHFQFVMDGKDDAFVKINALEDGFIKESLTNHMYVLLLVSSLFFNKVDDAKHYINKVQNNLTSYFFTAASYYYLAKIHFVGSFEMSEQNFKKALEICEWLGANEQIDLIKNKALPFVNLYHKRLDMFKDIDISSSLEQVKAYYYFQSGEISKAQELIAQVKAVNCPYTYFIRGIIFDDINSYWLSLMAFINQTEIAHLNLPAIELLKKGVSQEDLDSVLNGRGKSAQPVLSGNFFTFA